MNIEHALAVEEVERMTRDYFAKLPPRALTFLDFCALGTAHEATLLLGTYIAESFRFTSDGWSSQWEAWGHGDRVKRLGLRIFAQGFQIPPYLDEAVRNGTLVK